MDQSPEQFHIQFFKALSHPTRLKMVHILAKGERCVCDFEQELDCDMSSISRHLNQLKSAYIVTDQRRGKQVFYSLQAKCVLPFLSCIDANNPHLIK